ncbi:DUF4430 domain-containing protein [Virgibacillus dakarensis]|uniref:DUF4430 domain-containing protein n=1 Tax=Virgibacillus dakarensis TaxID=1917889 RepID=UPI000B44C0E5|nr:DUF4430 domain-containing protein [Virgibacillus dakarensis]MBT2216316.1 DUF4430 domain-containing protein [Virgibacillus dakarensis]MTW85164.1 DUF4430 domain-containing protein [Virgibacillus dakarensis]
MRQAIKIFASVMLTLLIVFSLSGCVESLKKPTGLEDSASQQAGDEDQDVTKDPREKEQSPDTGQAKSAKEKNGIAEQSSDSNTHAIDKKAEKKSSATKKENNKKTTQSAGANQQKSSKEPSQSKGSSTGSSNTDKSNTNAINKQEDSHKGSAKGSTKKSKHDKANSKENKQPETNKDTIVYSIVISGSEVPLPPTEIEITNEDTVLEALIQITKQKKIQMDYRGGQGATAYVEGIDNVYEFDRGQGSGWMYRINGVFPDRGAGVVPVCDGDRVEWLYTTNLGKDLGADLAPVRRDGKCPK